MKKLFLIPAALLLASCSFITKAKATIEVKPDLDTLLTSFNNNGYTKKTTFYLTEEERGRVENFHAGCNVAQRATYYNASEDALIMGDYSGGFANINSGYRNIENGVQHFRHVNEVTVENLFTSIENDWSMEGQSVGGYYPTLTSLSALEGINDWNYQDKVFSYSIEGLELVEGEYNDIVLQKFQYFAAPMLLQSERFSWTSIKIENKETYLSIRLYANATNDADKSTSSVENGEVLISEAKVSQGINL